MRRLRVWWLARRGLVPMTSEQMAYLSRAMFRQRMDKPDDSPELASRLDAHVSVWRMRLRDAGRETPDA